MFRQRGQQRPRFLEFAERLQNAFVQLVNRTLRFRVEPPDGLDFVAEELNAHRLLLLRRKNVEDAAADGVLAHHLDRIAALIPDAFEMHRQIVQRHFVMHFENLRQLAIPGGRLRSHERRRHRNDRDAGLAIRQTA